MNLETLNVCVADTGVLLELDRLGYLEVLQHFFTKALIPPAVLLELQSIVAPDWFDIVRPQLATVASIVAETKLGSGETEAIAIALEQQCWVLLDDRKARRYAKAKGITSIGTLGLLVAIHQNNRQIRDAKSDLELLAQGLWISEELLAEALQKMQQ